MKWLLPVVAAATLLGAKAHSSNGRRRSMGFQPEVDTKFNTEPQFTTTVKNTSDAYAVALEYVQLSTAGLSSRTSFYVREDAYEDELTGISHIYVRQVVDGLDVANGDLHLNIKDGKILAVSDSARTQVFLVLRVLMDGVQFYRGDVDLRPQGATVQESYCDEVETAVTRNSFVPTSQTVLDSQASNDGHLDNLRRWFDVNCATLHLAERAFAESPTALEFPFNLHQAVSRFLIHAVPEHYANDLWIQKSNRFRTAECLNNEGNLQTCLDHVQGALAPVRVEEAFMQIPHVTGPALVHVWKVCCSASPSLSRALTRTLYLSAVRCQDRGQLV